MSNISNFREEISQTYQENPFHNWPHGRYVWNTMMVLEWSHSKVTPWRMAGYFHDSDHTGIAKPDDEERACEIAERMLREEWYSKDYIDSVRLFIMWTIFKNRWWLYITEQKLIADADLSKLWGSYQAFIRNSVNYLLETHPKWEITDSEIQWYFKRDQPWFFKSLTDITKKEETPFLTNVARKKFPNFSKNKDRLAKDAEENLWGLIMRVRQWEKEPHVEKFRKAA